MEIHYLGQPDPDIIPLLMFIYSVNLTIGAHATNARAHQRAQNKQNPTETRLMQFTGSLHLMLRIDQLKTMDRA